MPLTASYLFLLVAAGALLLCGPARRMAWVGLVPLALGIGATTVRLGSGLPDLALRAAEAGAPLRFLQVNTGLILLGLVLVAVAAVRTLLRQPTDLGSWLALVLIGGGAAPIGAAHVPLLGYIGWTGPLIAAVVVAAAAAALFLAGRFLQLGRAIGWLDRNLLERQPANLFPPADESFDLIWVAGFLVSAVIMLVAPTLRAFVLAAVVAGTVSHVLLRRFGGGSPIPVSALLILLLVPVYQWFNAIAVDGPLQMHGLAGAPLSIAAENRIVPWLGLAALGLAGLWPLHGVVLPLAAPLAGVLLIRLGAHTVPSGMGHWAPAFMPLALLGIVHAAATIGKRATRLQRVIELLVGVALLGVFAGGEGVRGATWLLAASAVVPWSWLFRVLPPRPWGLGRLLWLPVIWGALLVLTAGLVAQVTYTVLAAGGIAVAIWVYHTPE